jgi:beta-glucosidase
MASFSSYRGLPMHANRYLLTTVLKRQLGFTGFVVSDWGAVSLLDGTPGLSSDEVATAIDAGIDMVMVPDDYRGFIALANRDVATGKIPVSRIDDAVRRILRVKFQLGLFEHPYADRSYLRTVGSAAHRALARQAVRESLVLLKNAGRVLPLRRDERILVAGANGDDIGNQSGGWTISWQGSSGATTPGTTIFEGIREVAGKQARVDYSRDGSGAQGYDVAIAVLGEKPYAETQGDRPSPDPMTLDEADLATLARLEQAHVPIVLVLVSGRPLVITSELPHVRAVVAAWLPGTEGGGVADVLFGAYRPTGKLPQTWPRSASQIPINVGDTPYRPLFPYGFGLSYPS